MRAPKFLLSLPWLQRLTSQTARSTEKKTRTVLNVGTTTTLGSAVTLRFQQESRPHAAWSGQAVRTIQEERLVSDAQVTPHPIRSLVAQVTCGIKSLCQLELANVWLARATTAPKGWHPPGSAAPCLIHLVDDEWGWCCL